MDNTHNPGCLSLKAKAAKKMRRMMLLAALLLVSLAVNVSASGNDTVDSIMNLEGNIPTSTIFFAVDGEDDTGSIELAPNATTTVSCWGVADDLDGISALGSVHSVIYAESGDRFGENNDSIVYHNNSCDTSAWDLGSGEWNCTFSVQYYAEPSDWTCAVNITNHPVTLGTGEDVTFYNDTINTTSTVEEIVALSVHNRTVDFGLRAVGKNYSADTSVLVYNEGNINLDLQLDAFNSSSTFEDDSDQAMNCTIGYVPTEYMRFSLVENQEYLDAVPMSVAGATSTQELGLAPQVFGNDDLPTSAFTYWAPGIPENIAGVCTGRLMYIGQVAE